MKTADKTLKPFLERYPRHPQHLINLLQDVQAEYSYISPEHLTLICDHVGVPVTQAWSVATFYKSFSLEPRGEHEIKVCLGTTCHLKGGQRLVEACERNLGVARGQTTDDLQVHPGYGELSRLLRPGPGGHDRRTIIWAGPPSAT